MDICTSLDLEVFRFGDCGTGFLVTGWFGVLRVCEGLLIREAWAVGFVVFVVFAFFAFF